MRRDSLPSNARRRPSQTMHFGAQSRGLRAPCERFAPWVTPGPRITRFRLAADLGRMGLDTHRVSNKVSKITSRHLVLLDRAFPAHALVHESELTGNGPTPDALQRRVEGVGRTARRGRYYAAGDYGHSRRPSLPRVVKRWCFRHQLLLSRPYLLQTKSLTPRFGDGRGCRCNNRL